MSDLATVFFGAQLGKETTAGTSVAADKLMQSLGFSRIKGQGEGSMFRPQGSKLNTTSVSPAMRHGIVDFQGVLTYNEIEYILNSAINSTTSTADGTNGKKWVHNLTKSAADTKQTYTFESGNSVHGQKATYAQVTSLQFEMSRAQDGNKVSGQMMCQALTDDITMTASPTQIDPVIVAPQTFDVKFATTQAGIAGASVFGRPIKAMFSLTNLVQPLFRMNSTDTSYVNLIEGPPTCTLTVTTDADDAGMTYLSDLTNGTTRFIEIKALGPTIAGAMTSTNTFQLQFSGKVIKYYDPTDENNSALASWTFEAVYDTTWTKAFEFTVINTLAAL